MTEQIRNLLGRARFRPFEIVTTDGEVFRIPSVDHAHVPPGGFRVVVWDDRGVHSTISVRHIVRINESAEDAA